MNNDKKSIWAIEPDLKQLNEWGAETMIGLLNIEITEFGPDFLKGRMPVDHRVHQPYGIMHGGVSCALAETVGSYAANMCVRGKGHYCVGLDINTSHLRMVKTGYVHAIAKPMHLGMKTQVWEIKTYDDHENLVSWTRLTMAVLEKK